MNDKLIQEILTRLDTIGNMALTSGKYAFEQQVKIIKADAIGTIFVILVIMILSGVFISRLSTAMIRWEEKAKESSSSYDMDKTDIKIFRNVLVSILTILVIGAFGNGLKNNVLTFIYPEAAAIKELLNK
jgi:hypothetical protein